MKNREQARSHKALVPSTATAMASLEVIGISADPMRVSTLMSCVGQSAMIGWWGKGEGAARFLLATRDRVSEVLLRVRSAVSGCGWKSYGEHLNV
jgi:hypothetical protein